MSEEKIYDLYKKYAHARIEEVKARKTRDNSKQYKIHYEMVELRTDISNELEKIAN